MKVENNKLIAEFMEFKQNVNNHYECHVGEGISILPPQYMKFNTDWNWLMPVIKKICKKSMDLPDCSEIKSIRYEILDDALYSNGIYDAHNSVVKLIKWYNETM